MNKSMNLIKETGQHFIVNFDYLKPYTEEILSFLEENSYMQTLDFAKSILFNEEIKFNNNIEGINDGIEFIDNIINKMHSSKDEIENKRIINLYKGYKYILSNKEINKENLKELYTILSDDLLNSHDKEMMGNYYRSSDVFILRGGHLTKPYMGLEEKQNTPFMGVKYDKIDELMDMLFEYINNNDDKTNNFVKSQIMHFYFVYIHPYFDVNGRTSRTVAIWYLINNKSYPYTIFNRAIAFSEKAYEENIIKAKISGNMTLFLKYMLESVLKALEKEYLINNISNNALSSISKEELQVLECFLSLKSELTVKDLAVIYNGYNNPKKIMELYNYRILPLIDKGIFLNLGQTKSYLAPNKNNVRLAINKKNISIDLRKVKHLNLSRYIY